MKKIILTLLFIFGTGQMWMTLDSQIIPLLDLPSATSVAAVAISGNRLYIASGNGASVYIYALPGAELVKVFGHEGNGLQDFKEKIYTLAVQGEQLVINSVGKLSYFSKDGKFIKQVATPLQDRNFRPFGSMFVGFGIETDKKTVYNTVNIYNADLKAEKTVTRLESSVQPGQGTKIFHGIVSVATCQDKLVVAGVKNFEIHVFNEGGVKTCFIRREYEKRRVTDDDKRWVLDILQSNPETKDFYEMMKPVRFPSTFPALREIHAADEKIYALTWKKENGMSECYIFDFQGKFLEKVYLPVEFTGDWDFYPLVISGGRMYQPVQGADQVWRLHITDID